MKKQGGFSVLFREEAHGKTKSGKPAIVPGDPDHSEFITRLTHRDPEERMPYQEAPLPKDEIAVLRKWIEQGAHWGEHWATPRPPRRRCPARACWRVSGLSENPGNKPTWIFSSKNAWTTRAWNPRPPPNRPRSCAALDLTGLPLTADQYWRFRENPSPETFSKLVDELLASPAYGERWAALWLDLSRYADSKGYESDHRCIVPG